MRVLVIISFCTNHQSKKNIRIYISKFLSNKYQRGRKNLEENGRMGKKETSTA